MRERINNIFDKLKLKNNKGFMLAEIIAVSVVLVVVLLGLFNSLNTFMVKSQDRENWNDVDVLYTAKSLSNLYDFEKNYSINYYDKINVDSLETTSLNDEVKNLIIANDIKLLYILKNNKESFDKFVTDYSDDDDFRKYVKNLSNNLVFNDAEKDNNIIIIKTGENSDAKYGYYKIPAKPDVGKITGPGTKTCSYSEDVEQHIEKPDVSMGLIPICFGEDDNLYVADGVNQKIKVKNASGEEIDCVYYEYRDSIWANAISVASSVRDQYIKSDGTYNVGKKVDFSSDSLAMFVWIPRFSYSIGCSGLMSDICYGLSRDRSTAIISGSLPGIIDVKFVYEYEKDNNVPKYQFVSDDIDATNSNRDNSWYTHPAFTWGNDEVGYEELSGIWVGKYFSADISGGWDLSDDIVIKPGYNAPDESDSYKLWLKHKNFIDNSIYGLNKFVVKNHSGINIQKTTDSHMIKNTEWAAVAYLSQSKFGKYGYNYECPYDTSFWLDNSLFQGKLVVLAYEIDPDGTNTQEENKLFDKRRAEEIFGRRLYSTPYAYDMGTSKEACSGWDETLVQYNATYTGYTVYYAGCSPDKIGVDHFSTSGNASGIFDMVGGAVQLVAGTLNFNNTNGKLKSEFPSGFFDDSNNLLYFNKYNSISCLDSDGMCDGKVCYGHAMEEIAFGKVLHNALLTGEHYKCNSWFTTDLEAYSFDAYNYNQKALLVNYNELFTRGGEAQNYGDTGINPYFDSIYKLLPNYNASAGQETSRVVLIVK